MTQQQPDSVIPRSTPGNKRASGLTNDDILKMHELMLTSRVLEERLIRMQKQGDGYFWIGGPGEEAFNTSLGLLVKKGQGLDYDFTHLHYRSSATLLGMGGDPVDALRQMRMLATDPFSGGRNFVGHYSARKWNMCPISSPIEIQYSIAIGTAMAQARDPECSGITIVQGGDAGSAEGDFATCLIWSSRPKNELPILIIVANNEWGISTHGSTQHGEKNVSDRGIPFGMRTKVIDGNDPEVAFKELQEAMNYVRTERKPMVLEARLSRLYGHSSSSGSNYVSGEPDCINLLEERLASEGLRSLDESKAMREKLFEEMQESSRRIKEEPKPTAESVWDHVFATENLVGQ